MSLETIPAQLTILPPDVPGMRPHFLSLEIPHVQQQLQTTSSRPHECHICQRGFTKRCDLKRHIASAHEGRKDYVCTVCFKAFTRKDDLNKHIGLRHISSSQVVTSRVTSSSRKSRFDMSHGSFYLSPG